MTAASDSQPPEQRQRRRRLLVIDDNKDAAESMSMLFELWGYEVICAYDGRSALETAAKYRPHAVFLDIGLPGMDGFEVARHLRAMPALARAFLIAMTGYASPEDLIAGKQAGFDEHLLKPVDLDTLREWLRTRV